MLPQQSISQQCIYNSCYRTRSHSHSHSVSVVNMLAAWTWESRTKANVMQLKRIFKMFVMLEPKNSTANGNRYYTKCSIAWSHIIVDHSPFLHSERTDDAFWKGKRLSSSVFNWVFFICIGAESFIFIQCISFDGQFISRIESYLNV